MTASGHGPRSEVALPRCAAPASPAAPWSTARLARGVGQGHGVPAEVRAIVTVLGQDALAIAARRDPRRKGPPDVLLAQGRARGIAHRVAALAGPLGQRLSELV